MLRKPIHLIEGNFSATIFQKVTSTVIFYKKCNNKIIAHYLTKPFMGMFSLNNL